jgi:putative tryptophan/tyrosine transport system substrate-binding protein
MHRRTFIGLLGSAAATWPGAILAQQSGRIFRVGLVMGVNTPVFALARAAFVDEMQKAGFVEGRHFALETRTNQVAPPQLLALMNEFVASKVDVIVAGGTEQTLRAAVSASRITPIVMWANNFDPLTGGYVQSLARPGGNVTGVFTRQPELAEKQLELLKEAFPQRKRLAIVWDAQTADQFEAAKRRAQLLGFEVDSHKLDGMPYDIPAVFRAIMSKNPELLQVASGPNIGTYQQIIVDQAMQYRLPSIYIFKTYVERGGLISYGIDIGSSFRRIAASVAKILNGAKPADLPIEQPNTYEMVVNLKTAKAIGLEVPTSILLRANEVIE